MIRLHFVDTFDQINALRKSGQRTTLATWRKYAQAVHPALPEKCMQSAEGYSFQAEVAPMLDLALGQLFGRVYASHQVFCQLADGLEKRVQHLFDVDLTLWVYFYLGLCNGAGWATKLGDQPVILLGAEKIAELAWHDESSMTDLVCHEVAHQVHYALRKGVHGKLDPSIGQMYFEGFAVRTSQLLHKEGYYHQDKDGWLDFCKQNLAEIKTEYLLRLEKGESVSDFFGDWHAYRGHSDVGYYLGGEFIRWMASRHTLHQVALLPREVIENYATAFLSDID